MARRFYLPSSPIADVNPSFSAEWNVTGSADRFRSVTILTGSTFVSKTTANNSTINQNILNRQYVSNPLGAQIISSGVFVSGQLIGSESNAAMDGISAVGIRVVSNNGLTLRGTVISVTVPTLLNNEYTTTLTNRFTPSGIKITTGVVVQNGDRLVFEIGVRQLATSTNRNVTHRFGDTGVLDLAIDQTSTTDANPWIEFSQDIPLRFNTTFITNEQEELAI